MDVKDRIKLFCKKEGISIKNFEDTCGMSNGYINAMRKGLGHEKLNNVLSAYPKLNRDWLLYGEGEMLKGGVIQNNEQGDNISGQSVTVSKADTDALLDALKRKDEQLSKSQEQIDELIGIIKNMSNSLNNTKQ